MSYNGARPKVKRNIRVPNCENSENQEKERSLLSEEDSSIFDRHLSVRLYDALDSVGASSEFRKLRQEYAISQELIITINSHLHQRLNNYDCFIFGSSSEGTTTPGLHSDIDYLFCFKLPAVVTIDEAGWGLSLLMIREKHTKPGYVKLQSVQKRHPQTVNERYVNCEYEEYDSEGRICVKHVSMLGLFLIGERNGPADTDTDRNTDYVCGYRCSKIPDFANAWIGRVRQYKWPSKRMLDKMATMGCFVVGVGHPASKEINLEWRLSFSLQERELMFSLNNVQHKCYIVLKMIKKDLIEPKVGKSLSSYHLKTCIFYVIENTRLSFWKRDNLTQCVMLSLLVLFKWVYLGYCPNYFMNDENMFDRDIHRRQRLNLLKRLYCLLCNGCGFMFLINVDQIGVFLSYSASNIHTARALTGVRLKEKLKFINSVLIFKNGLCYNANARANSIHFLRIILKYVSKTKRIMNYNEQQTQMTFKHILPFIHIQLAQSCASLAFNTTILEAKSALIQEFGYYLRKGRNCNITSSTLLEATVFLKLEQYERCIVILDRLEQMINQKPLSVCKCFNRATNISNEYVKLCQLSVSEVLAKTTPCMIFLRSDLSVTPEALQYEMFRSIDITTGTRNETADKWFDMAMVDALVYLHFLQYLAHAKVKRRIQKHIAIHKLEAVLKREQILGHRETGYNLLGWIHFLENWIPRGITYFQTSLSIQPHHNAAKLHILKWIRDRNYQE